MSNESDYSTEQTAEPKDLPREEEENENEAESQFIYNEQSNSLLCIGEHFDHIPKSIIENYARKTRILDLSKNRFRYLKELEYFVNLEELYLDDNRLEDELTVFPRLENLKVLSINKNHFRNIYNLSDQLRQALPKLNHLSLLDNEACPYRIIPTTTNNAASTTSHAVVFAQDRLNEDYQRYRHILIYRLNSLKFLDARAVSQEERNLANRLGALMKSNDHSQTEEKPNNNYTPLSSVEYVRKPTTMATAIKKQTRGENSEGNRFIKDSQLG